MKINTVNDLNSSLNIDFNFEHLIGNNNDEIEKKELNDIPFRQALRIDNRQIFEIFTSVFIKEIEILNIFFYRNPYSHFSLTISIYLLESLLDLTFNFLLYTDDVVSEKYNNDGELSFFTSISLSLISNIISSIIIFIISKLANYPDIIEAIIKNVKNKAYYLMNIRRVFKFIRLKLAFFFFFEIILCLLMTYYLFIFCTVFHQSQGSIMYNYFIGICLSLAKSIGLTIIITIMRYFSIKNRSINLYNTSKYLYEHI